MGSSLVCEAGLWILDSGCTYHMCPNKEWFSNINMVEGGTLFMGNDHACKPIGLGKIILKLHDGSVRILFNVRMYQT